MNCEVLADLYCLIDDYGSAEVEIPCRLTFTFHEGRSVLPPRGEYAPIDPPEPPTVEDIRLEVLTGYDSDGKPQWGRLPAYLNDRLVAQFEDKVDWLVDEARQQKEVA